MFTKKTESENPAAIGPQSPSATTIEIIAIRSGISPATTAPKTMQQHDQRRREAELELARLEVVLGEVVEVVVERPLAGHHHAEAVPAVALLDHRQERIDVGLSLDPDQDGVPVARGCQRRRAVDDARRLRPREQLPRRTAGSREPRTVSAGERTTISSSTPRRSGGKSRAKIRSAWADSGLPVTWPFVVRLPGRSVTASPSATTIAPSQPSEHPPRMAARDPRETLGHTHPAVQYGRGEEPTQHLIWYPVPMAERPSVRLEPWAEGDLPLLRRLLGDPAMTEHLGGPESEEKLVERQARTSASATPAPAGCSRSSTRRAASPSARSATGRRTGATTTVWETGWSVLPEFQGRGIAGEATRQAIDAARADGKHRCFHAFPSVDNAPSNAICRKLGFELLGAFDFEYPPGHPMRCNDWRLDLSGGA